ncbi:MAG: DUF2914 domain-containing protein [Gammaproteobacteria bacterium]|nr:DUF2914 domain-containing protein [Gammaproteobacteria bacterium]
MKLTIQIKLDDVVNFQELEQAPIDPRKVVSFIVLLILPLVLFGVYHWSESNQNSVVANEFTVTSELQQQVDITSEVVEPSNQQLPIEPLNSSMVQPIERVEIDDPQLTTITLAAPLQVKAPVKALVEEIAEPVEAKETAQTQEIAINQPLVQDIVIESASQKIALSETEQSAKTNQSDYITRITLTSGIVQREPVDDLGNRIDGDDERIVFLFNEIRDLAGQTLTHRWLLNGEEIARVNLPVGGARWRTYSSKTITPTMVGVWQVEVLNNKGELLSVHKFDYYH